MRSPKCFNPEGIASIPPPRCLNSFRVVSISSATQRNLTESVLRHALRAGFTIEEIFNLTKIDVRFLVQIKEIVDFEEELSGATASRPLLV